MKITTKYSTVLWIFFATSIGYSGTFFDDFSDIDKSKEIWEVVHRDWKITDGFIGRQGKPV